MRGKFNRDIFEYIEKKGNAGVTSREVAQRAWISPRYARTWLSRFTNYRRPDGTVKHYLIYNPPPPGSIRGGKRAAHGTYTIGPDWWGEMCFKKQEL
jgi:hypothetical protein